MCFRVFSSYPSSSVEACHKDENMSDQERLLSTLKKEVRSLLMPIKGGLPLAKLEQEYRSMIGKQLPYRALGYQSTINLVMDMPDVVKICRGRDGSVVLKAIADESTVGIASLVARQKSRPKHVSPRLRPECPIGYASHHILSEQTQISRSLLRRGHVPPTLPAIVKSQLKELLRSSPVLLSDFNKTFAHHFGRPFEFRHFGFFSMSEVLNAASDIITVVQTRAGSLLTLKTSPSLKKPTEKLPEPKVVVKLNDVKQTLPPAESAPTVDTCSLAPNPPTQNQDQTPSQESNTSMVQLKPQETQGVKCDKMKQLQKQMKMALVQQGLGGTVSTELKKKIKTIAAQYPEGLLVSKLPSEFEAHFKERLPVRELGFLTLMELVGALSDVLHIECKEGEQDWCIFDIDSQCLANDEEIDQELCLSGSLAHEETSDKHEQSGWDFPLEGSKNLETKFSIVTKMVTRHLGLEEPHIMQEIMKDEIPPDAVRDRSLYRLPQLDSAALVGVSVEYVVSPSQFYVQIYSAETSDKLEDMMIEMRRCYASKNVADRYIIPEAAVKSGHLCCVRNLEDKWWYRGIIHRVLSNEEVEVFYLDFGNMGIVPKSYLRLLKDCYANLAAQAIPCSLAQMKPARGDWTSAAILEFQKLCGLKLLVGVVDEYIDGVLYLFLCDTSTEEDIYIHDVLRLEGHAVICRTNIPSKGFRELNPSTLYLKPRPEEYVALKQVDVSLFESFPETAHSEPCEDEVHFRRFDEKREDLACLKPERWAKENECFGISSEKSLDCQERNSCKDSRGPVPKEQTLQTKDTASWCSAPEKPYLEPVFLCTEIWDEDWIPLLSAEEAKNGNTSNNLRIDTYVQNQTCSDKGSKNEAQHNQELENQVADSLGSTTDSLSPIQDEFYISVVHSQQSSDPSQIALDVNPVLACNSQPLPALSAFPVDECNGEAPSKKKMGDASGTQIVALSTPSPCSVQGERGRNALVFTAELQGSPVFCIPYNPSAALGASARLATSGGYFSLSQRKMNL